MNRMRLLESWSLVCMFGIGYRITPHQEAAWLGRYCMRLHQPNRFPTGGGCRVPHPPSSFAYLGTYLGTLYFRPVLQAYRHLSFLAC